MLKGIVQKRIRYAETDKMGYLYYGKYAMLYEIGRAELIRSVGITYKDTEDIYKIMMPVVHLECRYRLPAKYDDLISIHTELREMPTKMIHFYHEVYNQQDELLNSGQVKLFFVNMENNKRVSCPTFIKDKFDPYF